MTVLDLGSGAGFDAFLAWNRVGATGHVIGVDMTDDMLSLARENAAKRGATNVEFRKGFIEKLPVESGTVDYVISNCVINLSTDKPAVFHEIARVLKPGGRFAVSDIVLLKPLPEPLARDISAYVGCISGASMLTDYSEHGSRRRSSRLGDSADRAWRRSDEDAGTGRYLLGRIVLLRIDGADQIDQEP